MTHPYHHGDLPETLLRHAVESIASRGPEGLSLRELARSAGVSHAAPAHHFGDRRGLLTAVAVQGQDLLSEAMEAALPEGFEHVAVAYVRFAGTHPGHFAVLHRRALLDGEDQELLAARARSDRILEQGVLSLLAAQRGELDVHQAKLAAWSLVQGIAALSASGALAVDDVEQFTVRAAMQLFRPTA